MNAKFVVINSYQAYSKRLVAITRIFSSRCMNYSNIPRSVCEKSIPNFYGHTEPQQQFSRHLLFVEQKSNSKEFKEQLHDDYDAKSQQQRKKIEEIACDFFHHHSFINVQGFLCSC